jgi:NitT/TauT family transport system ATP-binding protein
MSTNAHNFPAQVPRPIDFPVDAGGSLRVGGARGKSGSSTLGLPLRGISSEVAKVGLTDICLSYRTQSGERMLALDHINLQVKAGEFLCIVGPSGCGKSTLLHLIAGLHKQTSGQVLVDGKQVEGPGPDRILIFQELGLFPWLTVSDNVQFGMKMKGIGKAEREEKTRYYLKLVHLLQFKDSYTHQLSGGMRQRVALARALAAEPDVLLMDEPFAALDAQTRDLLHDELERIWAETGRTIIFVTHNVREAIRLGDRVALMTFRPGRVKREFPIDLPRPRVLEDLHVARAAGEILGELREEINRSLAEEYHVGVKPHVEVEAEASGARS